MNNPNRPNFGGENLDGQDANSGWNDNFDQGNENVDGQLNNGGVNQEVNNQAEMDQATREELLRTQYEGMDALMDERNTLQERIDLINDRLSQLPENASLDVRETLLREKERLIQARLKNVENRRRLMAGEPPILDGQAAEPAAEEDGGVPENDAASVENATPEGAEQQNPGQTIVMSATMSQNDFVPIEKVESYEVDDPPTKEEVQAFVEKNGNKKDKVGVAKFASYLVRLIPPIGMVLSLYAGAFALSNKTGNDMEYQQAGITQVENGDHYIGAVEDVQRLVGYEQNEQGEQGIYDGYNEKGMWASPNKSGKYNFASASEVAEVCNNDPRAMIMYMHDNQVETMAQLAPVLPDWEKPDGLRVNNINEAESAIEGMSDEQYSVIDQQFEDIINRADISFVTLEEGDYDNAYMRMKDPNGPLTHENMEIVHSVTHEKDLTVTRLTWTNKETGETVSVDIKMTPVYDEAGNLIGFTGCMQIIIRIESDGETKVFEGTPEVDKNETDDNGTDDSTDDGTNDPTDDPTNDPTDDPTNDPTDDPTNDPTDDPTNDPTDDPTNDPTDDPTNDPTDDPTNDPTDDPTDDPEQIQPKDPENYERIGDQMNDDNERDRGPEEIGDNELEPGAETDVPEDDVYDGTEPTIVPNEPSQEAEPVQPTLPENDYSENQGSAYDNEYSPNTDNQAAQDAANQAETPVDQAPQVNQDTMADFGF